MITKTCQDPECGLEGPTIAGRSADNFEPLHLQANPCSRRDEPLHASFPHAHRGKDEYNA